MAFIHEHSAALAIIGLGAVALISELLPFVAKLEGNGIIHSMILALKKTAQGGVDKIQ